MEVYKNIEKNRSDESGNGVESMKILLIQKNNKERVMKKFFQKLIN